MAGAFGELFEVELRPGRGALRLRAPQPLAGLWLERFGVDFELRRPEELGEEGTEAYRHVRGRLREALLSVGTEAVRRWARGRGVELGTLRPDGLALGPGGPGEVPPDLVAFSGHWAVDGADLLFGLPRLPAGGSWRDGMALAAELLGRLGARWDAVWSCWRWDGAAAELLRAALCRLGMRLPRDCVFVSVPRLREDRLLLELGGRGPLGPPAAWRAWGSVYEALWAGDEAEAERRADRLNRTAPSGHRQGERA